MKKKDRTEEEMQLEKDRKEIVKWYIENGLVENCIDKDGNIRMSQEELDDWEWYED